MNLSKHAISAMLALLIIANIMLLINLGSMDEQLAASGKNTGILHFELAGSTANANRIMQAWGDASVETVARNSIWLDFAFLLAYPILLALSCWLLAADASIAMAKLGIWLGYSVLACAPLDAFENIGMLHMLDHGADYLTVLLTTLCAAIKWLLALATLLYVIVGLAGKWFRS